ncbi:MAG: redox-sensing transcriptional repressor Rex [Firmicutes bacterium]|nr:redox-sensing transcriptional repressor Rex [Bacillota bacterium]
MKDNIVISKATIDRLPLYFRTLKQVEEEGVIIISSEELGRRIGITPEQIRKDFASFGEFGKKGVGYFVRELLRNVGEILGLHRNWNIAIVGVGHLGWALANYINFEGLGCNLQAIFDIAPHIVGRQIKDIVVDHFDNLEAVIKERHIHIGVITVPNSQAQAVVDRLTAAGIKGIWNFATIKVHVPEGTCLVNEDLSMGLSSVSYYLTRQLPEK